MRRPVVDAVGKASSAAKNLNIPTQYYTFMKISIITVPWNSKEKIGQQIESVRKAATGLEFEEIAIDNASSDGTADFIRQNFLQVKLVANDKNVGFAAAN